MINDSKKYKNFEKDPENIQYLPKGLESDLLIGGDLFIPLGSFDFFNPKKECLKEIIKRKED